MIDIRESQPVILVVDDNALLRMAIVDTFADEGFGTVEAEDGDDALGQLKLHPEISVLFTDINMPGSLDGLQLARAVHAYRPDVYLILTSGHERPRSCDIADSGRFIPKPYVPQMVVQMVRDSIR